MSVRSALKCDPPKVYRKTLKSKLHLGLCVAGEKHQEGNGFVVLKLYIYPAYFSGAVSLWSRSEIRKKAKGSLSLWCIIIYITIPLGEWSEHIMLSLEKPFSFLIWILIVMFLRLNVSPEIRFVCETIQKE